MLKRSLVAVAVVALLAMSVQAGEIKTHTWPCDFKAMEITSIPVLMDIGYYINIKNQNDLHIHLVQDTVNVHTFHGCTNMTVESNFAAVLTCSITGNGKVTGTYSCSIANGGAVALGSNTIEVCADLVNAGLATGQLQAGSTNVQVATVKISVKPV